MTEEPTLIDPTQAARDWLGANPDDPAAVHVRAALDSAARYEHLSQELAAAEPGKIRVVICTYDRHSRLVLTLADRSSEARIAEVITRMHHLVTSLEKATKATKEPK